MASDTVLDLTTGRRRGQFQLYVSPKSLAAELHAAGVKMRPTKGATCSLGYFYELTLAAARQLAKVAPAPVTYYRQPIAPALAAAAAEIAAEEAQA